MSNFEQKSLTQGGWTPSQTERIQGQSKPCQRETHWSPSVLDFVWARMLLHSPNQLRTSRIQDMQDFETVEKGLSAPYLALAAKIQGQGGLSQMTRSSTSAVRGFVKEVAHSIAQGQVLLVQSPTMQSSAERSLIQASRDLILESTMHSNSS